MELAIKSTEYKAQDDSKKVTATTCQSRVNCLQVAVTVSKTGSLKFACVQNGLASGTCKCVNASLQAFICHFLLYAM